MAKINLEFSEGFANDLLCFLDLAEGAIKKEYDSAADIAFAEGRLLRQMLQNALPEEAPPEPEPKGIWWLHVSKDEIYNLAGCKLPQGLEWVDHFHCTLKFNTVASERPFGYSPSNEEDNFPFIKVKGFAFNHKAACLVVEVNGECDNKYPHITLGLAEGVPPVYCNEMLAGVYSYRSLEGELNATLTFYEFPNQ